MKRTIILALFLSSPLLANVTTKTEIPETHGIANQLGKITSLHYVSVNNETDFRKEYKVERKLDCHNSDYRIKWTESIFVEPHKTEQKEFITSCFMKKHYAGYYIVDAYTKVIGIEDSLSKSKGRYVVGNE